MKFEKTRVMNFEGSIRGMRNPMDSWDKSDSYFGLIDVEYSTKDYDIADNWVKSKYPTLFICSDEYEEKLDKFSKDLIKNGILKMDDISAEVAFIGPNDMKLAQKLIKAGSEHRKFMRQIFVSVDITAPRYWWAEADTYKISTTANSTSSMHTLISNPITINNFEVGDFETLVIEDDSQVSTLDRFNQIIEYCEKLRQLYNETKDRKYWKELIRILPQSFLQTRTWTANYEILRNIYNQRKGHKLVEWEAFRKWIETLPYAEYLIMI